MVGPVITGTGSGLTIIVASLELAEAHTPLWTTARYFVVTVRLVAVKLVVVFAISTGVVQLSVEDCHVTTIPV